MHEGCANLDLGTYVNRARRQGVNLKRQLEDFVRNNRYANARLGRARQVGPVKGYPLRTRMGDVRPVDDNVLVAGEAAGLVNPLNGEGIGAPRWPVASWPRTTPERRCATVISPGHSWPATQRRYERISDAVTPCFAYSGNWSAARG